MAVKILTFCINKYKQYDSNCLMSPLLVNFPPSPAVNTRGRTYPFPVRPVADGPAGNLLCVLCLE